MSDTRQRLILTAMRLFGEKGYASTSVADILREAGANSGSLYHFFPTKQDLLVAVLEEYRAGMRLMLLEPAWQGVEDPIERVFALLGHYRNLLLESECVYGCPIGYLALELHEPDPAVREAIAANFEGWTQAIEECLSSADDRLPAGTDLRSLAAFVLITMEGGVMLSRTYRSVEPFDAGVARLREHFDRLMVTS
jgi:TetR/AcrR family transcriptional regulator, transcriptional repressor for nem operon